MKLIFEVLKRMAIQVGAGCAAVCALAAIFFLIFWPAYIWGDFTADKWLGWQLGWWCILWFGYMLVQVGAEGEDERARKRMFEKTTVGIAGESLNYGDAVYKDTEGTIKKVYK